MIIPLDEFGEVVSTVTTGVNYTKWGNETMDGYNLRMAYEHFTLAADAGLADAYTNVGIMLLNGQGVKRNYTGARYWFKEGANAGLTTPMYVKKSLLLYPLYPFIAVHTPMYTRYTCIYTSKHL